jgi:tRNA1(Val) A37 N6-methylase TrmN6
MSCSCNALIDATARHFDEARVGQELSAYRSAGPGVTTRGLLSRLVTVHPLPETMLDIGSGIGAVTLELLKAGVRRAVCVDLSQAALAANAEEAGRQKVADRIRQVEGDFVVVAETVPSADLVVLDRVVCCYPSFGSLLELAADHSDRLLAMSFPRDRWWVRLALWFENRFRQLRRDGFRAFVHSPVAMAAVLQGRGFRLSHALSTWTWQMEIYTRGERA